MKKAVKLLCLMLAFVSVFTASLLGCSGTGGNGKVTVLRVWNYDGGVGHDWLDAAIARFEAQNATKSYESGKTGVKIEVLNTKDTTQLSNMAISTQSLYFTQGIRYNGLQADGKVLNISDVVTSIIEEEGVSIESKLSENTKTALKAYDGNYYVLPHYQSFNGVIYNKTLFDERGFYFAKDATDYVTNTVTDAAYGFVKTSKKDDVSIRTVGPDGKAGTDDDGLPSSIEEYERLCKYMIDSNVTPFIWADGSNKSYQMALTNALWLNLEGYEGVMANFTFDSKGVETDIVTGFDASNNPVTKSVAITKSNIQEIYQQESRYWALYMSQKVFANADYYHKFSLSGTYSHTFIQKTYLESKFTGQPIGMILEGSYWENEAKTSGELKNVTDAHPEAANLDLRMMPLPVIAKGSVTSEQEGRDPVHLDMLSSYAFINANVKEKYGEGVEKLAKDFLKFCYTDASLAEFTVKSSVTKDLTYDLSPADYNSLSNFGKTVWDAKKNNKVVVPISGEAEYIKNTGTFTMFSDLVLWQTTAGTGYSYPVLGFKDGGLSAKDYFLGMAKTRTWWDSLLH